LALPIAVAGLSVFVQRWAGSSGAAGGEATPIDCRQQLSGLRARGAVSHEVAELLKCGADSFELRIDAGSFHELRRHIDLFPGPILPLNAAREAPVGLKTGSETLFGPGARFPLHAHPRDQSIRRDLEQHLQRWVDSVVSNKHESHLLIIHLTCRVARWGAWQFISVTTAWKHKQRSDCPRVTTRSFALVLALRIDRCRISSDVVCASYWRLLRRER
jgi:hypothetical protein